MSWKRIFFWLSISGYFLLLGFFVALHDWERNPKENPSIIFLMLPSLSVAYWWLMISQVMDKLWQIFDPDEYDSIFHPNKRR